ncbi:hypothetical protein pb186bvf_011048 [Paramecium bursaria]
MNTISSLFKTSTSFERNLRNTTILNSSPTLNVQDLKLVMLGFSSNKMSTPQPIRQSFMLFFSSLPDKPSFRVKLKILATCHVLLDDFMWGSQFAEYLIQWQGFKNKQQFVQLREKDPLKQKFVLFYYELLARLGNSNINQFNHFKATNKFTSQTINLLNIVFQNTQLIDDVLIQNFEDITFEILLLIWNDVIALYLFFEKIILEFLVDYQKLEVNVFFTINGLLQDFLSATEKIQQFFTLTKHLHDQKQFLEPQWKKIEKKQFEEIQSYGSTLKINSTKQKLQNKKPSQTLVQSPHPTSSQQSFFSNTTFAYVKRLSTCDDPFMTEADDQIRKKSDSIKRKN